MVSLTKGLKIWRKKIIVSSLNWPCHGALTLYLRVLSTTMAQYMHIRCVMTGVRMQRITTHKPQRHTSICIRHRNLKLKAYLELEQVAGGKR
ncbi:uncharacterized protein [Euphorbia lathyris]|uniref:uncharacterized protein isoform X3 n=1 Tax=Euphorbia lathyris TaxID=212925 RepID=UPI003313B71C